MSLLSRLLAASTLLGTTLSSKRGLCFTPNENHPEDNKVWVQPGSDIKWYYNYQSLPSPAYANLGQEELEYIPMMWGLGSSPNDTVFLNQVKKLVSEGRNIERVLGFKEPDASPGVGGSHFHAPKCSPGLGGQFRASRQHGHQAGTACLHRQKWEPDLAQAVSGQLLRLGEQRRGKQKLLLGLYSFHWYDNFAGLVAHIGERKATWPDAEIWVTEYAYAHHDLGPTQEFYMQTADYFDKVDYIGRYSYFGAFRANRANVGPNAAFLNNGGQLTDIGSWYLGFGATDVTPQSGKSTIVAPSAKIVAVSVMAALALT